MLGNRRLASATTGLVRLLFPISLVKNSSWDSDLKGLLRSREACRFTFLIKLAFICGWWDGLRHEP
jgi:hypothetical protein